MSKVTETGDGLTSDKSAQITELVKNMGPEISPQETEVIKETVQVSILLKLFPLLSKLWCFPLTNFFFQAGQMFMNKAGAYPGCLTLKIRPN